MPRSPRSDPSAPGSQFLGSSRALAVFAHPDDAELACGGTLAAWAAAGWDVHLLVVCRGDKGSSRRVDGEELAQQREAEGRAAAAVLCLSGWDCLGYSDGEVDRVPLRRDLVGEIRTFRPSVVVAPDPTSVFFGSGYVNHRDHLEVGWAALEAVTPDAANPNYCPDLGEPHAVGEVLLSGSLAADYAVDIASQRERKAAALGCHLSQLGGGSELGVDESVLAEMVSARAMAEGKSLGVAYAESFRRLRFGAA